MRTVFKLSDIYVLQGVNENVYAFLFIVSEYFMKFSAFYITIILYILAKYKTMERTFH